MTPLNPNGNLTSDGTKTYEWDAQNRLTAVKQGGSTLASFTYDGDGRRAAKTASGVTTSYVYDAAQFLEERPSPGTTRRYVYGAGIDEALAQVVGATTTYNVADHLGSVVRATDSLGNPTFTREYDPWGNLLQGSATSGYAFTGREWDAETGLYYYRARYYDPKIGRFLSEDPIGFFGGVNFYAYVDNNPVNSIDPTGLLKGPDPFSTITGVCKATVGTATTTATTTIGLVLLATPVGVGSDFEPGEPRPPTCDKTDTCDRSKKSPCDKLLELCLENPWQPPHRVRQWGRKKDCGACYRECVHAGGAWPFYKCPIF